LFRVKNGTNTDEAAAKAFLQEHDKESSRLSNLFSLADWSYNTNLTEENAKASVSSEIAIDLISNYYYFLIV